MSTVRVLTVDHEDEARRSTRSVVSATPGFSEIGEATTAEEALELAMELEPDLALVATGLPGIDGFETSRRLLDARPATTVVLLYSTPETDEAAVAGSGAARALHVGDLAPASLQALWRDR
jgi:DNA-binding NarL/FixJ family response regulator